MMARAQGKIRAKKKKDGVREEVWEDGLLMPDQIKVREDEFKRLYIRIGEKEFRKLKARYVFPLSGKADYVSFINSEGRETAMLAHPHKLERKSRDILNGALKRMYFSATILRVDSISEKMGITTWQAETDRGYARFEILDRENIRRLPGNRVMLTDADGNRFEITNTQELDQRSQSLVFTEV